MELDLRRNSRNIFVSWLTTSGVIVDYYAKKDKNYKLKTNKLLKKLYIAEEDFFSIQGNNDFSKVEGI